MSMTKCCFIEKRLASVKQHVECLFIIHYINYCVFTVIKSDCTQLMRYNYNIIYFIYYLCYNRAIN